MLESWKLFAQKYGPVISQKDLPSSSSFTGGRDLKAICTLAQSSPARSIVEIGTALGHTAVALAMACPRATVVTFGITRELAGKTESRYDNEIQSQERQGSFIRKQRDHIKSRITSRILSLDRGRSMLSRAAPFAFEFAYIDADHTWRSVVEDTKAVVERIADHGVIVWDDYGTANEVRAFIDILNSRTGNRIIAVGHTRIAYIKLDAEQRELILRRIWDL